MKKFITASSLFTFGLWAQAVPPPPGMRAPNPAGIPGAMPNSAQAASPMVPPDTVVAELNGKKYTAAELDKLMSNYPPQVQMAIRSNPALGLKQVLLFAELEKMAVQEKLDQESPLKEALSFQRLQTLAQAEINHYRLTQIVIKPDEELAYYKAHPDKYAEVKIRVIKIAFAAPGASTAGDRKALTREEAKAKADDLRKKLAAGADFAALAKEYSDDKASAANGGEYGAVNGRSSYPDNLKKPVFALKQGEISEPIEQVNSFYLVRADQVGAQEFSEVQGQVQEDIRNERFSQWMKAQQDHQEVKIENPNYFAPRMPAGLPQQLQTRPAMPPNAK